MLLTETTPVELTVTAFGVEVVTKLTVPVWPVVESRFV